MVVSCITLQCIAFQSTLHCITLQVLHFSVHSVLRSQCRVWVVSGAVCWGFQTTTVTGQFGPLDLGRRMMKTSQQCRNNFPHKAHGPHMKSCCKNSKKCWGREGLLPQSLANLGSTWVSRLGQAQWWKHHNNATTWVTTIYTIYFCVSQYIYNIYNYI